MSKEEDLIEEATQRGELLVSTKYPGKFPPLKALPPNIDLLPPGTFSPGAIGFVRGSVPLPSNSAQNIARITGNTVHVVATSVSTMILPADANRTFLFFENDDSLGFARVAFGVDATLATGMKLGSGGGGILLDNHVPTGAVFIIGSIASNANITMIYG